MARSGLGTLLNHTLLSVEALRGHNIPLLGIIFSDKKSYDQDDLLVLDHKVSIARITGLPILGRLPRCADFDEGRRFFAEIGNALHF